MQVGSGIPIILAIWLTITVPLASSMGSIGSSLKDGERAFKRTLLNLHSSNFRDPETGLPYDTLDLNLSTWGNDGINGGDVCELMTPYWVYMMATGDGEIRRIMRRTSSAYLTYLDPGTGFVGNYEYDTKQNELSPGFRDDLSGPNWAYDGRLLRDAEHGAEGALYMSFPAAWYFEDTKAIHSLEDYAENLLQQNKGRGQIHFHLFMGNAYDTWQVADWGGEPGFRFTTANWVDPRPDAFTDLMEFWWILPALGAAVVTDSDHLRERIVARVALAMDDILESQTVEGQVDFVFSMDGTFSNFSQGYGTSPGIYSYQNWARACYFMDHLTGQDKYVPSLGRYLRWLVRNRPTDRADLLVSMLVFHSYYANAPEYLDLAGEVISALGEDIPEGDVSWAVCRAIYYSGTLDPVHLDRALEAEQRIREMSVREVQGREYYFVEGELESNNPNTKISKWDVDRFRGRISGVFLCAERGGDVHGLVDRNLLLLGWLLDESSIGSGGFGRTGLLMLAGLVLVVIAGSGAYLRRKGLGSGRPSRRRRKPECKQFETIEECYRCKYLTAAGGKQYCSKHKIVLKGDVRLRRGSARSRELPFGGNIYD